MFKLLDIAHQAGAKAHLTLPMLAVTGVSFTHAELEKFVELIVLECIDIANKSGNIQNKSELAVCEANRIAEKIEQHFGVEK